MNGQEEKLINALTYHIISIEKSFRAAIYANYMPNGQNSKNIEEKLKNIEEVWKTFFDIAKNTNSYDLYNQIICSLNKFLKENGHFDFSDNETDSWDVSIYEGYIKSLLIRIDETVYTNDLFDKDYNKMLGFALKELKKRSSFVLDKNRNILNFASALERLHIVKNTRNSLAHPNKHNWGEGMCDFVEGFFVATIIYTYIKDIAAKGYIQTNVRSLKTITKDSVTIYESTIEREKESFTIDKKFFGDQNKITVQVKFSAPDRITEKKELEITRGDFSKNCFPKIIELRKQDSVCEDRRKHNEHLNNIPKTQNTELQQKVEAPENADSKQEVSNPNSQCNINHTIKKFNLDQQTTKGIVHANDYIITPALDIINPVNDDHNHIVDKQDTREKSTHKKDTNNTNNNKWEKKKWKHIGTFYHGYAVVQDENDKWGIIHSSGSIEIPCKWKKTGEIIDNGLVCVQDENDRWGYIDLRGNIITPCKWKYADPYFSIADGLAHVLDEKDIWGAIDKSGNIIIPCKWKKMYRSSRDGLACVQDKNHKWGFIDKTGKTVISCKWENIDHCFNQGLACVQDKNHKWGAIDKSGNIVIPCKWKKLENYPGQALCPVHCFWGHVIIDRKGKILLFQTIRRKIKDNQLILLIYITILVVAGCFFAEYSIDNLDDLLGLVIFYVPGAIIGFFIAWKLVKD